MGKSSGPQHYPRTREKPPSAAPPPIFFVSSRQPNAYAVVALGIRPCKASSHARMNTIRWILAAPLFLLGAWAILYHWRLIVLFIRVRFFGCQHKWESSVPLFGPICICLGCLVAPMPALLRYCWLSFVIDPATYTFVVSLPFLFRELWTTKNGP